MHLCKLPLLSLEAQGVVLQDLQEASVGAACADRRCGCSFLVCTLQS